METSCSQSTLEILPDEILLEVCKYLLCSDILYSFNGLNYRITQMITQYRHHVSLHKTSISIFDYLCVNILPQIGSQTRSLLIDCCYSVLQDELFIQYFGKKMSMIFPNLERISLVSYQQNQLVDLLNTLCDLNHLVEIRLYGLFSIERLYQPIFVPLLFQANDHRLTTILFDDRSSSLSFNDTDRYLNILQLCINLRKTVDLLSLFAAIPNVQHLDVIIEERDDFSQYFEGNKLSPLLHLTNFQLKSIIRRWTLEELITIFIQLPTVQHLSLFLSTYDKRLIQGDIILSSLPSTVQQFNYAIYFFSNTTFDQDDTIIGSWPPSHPVSCFFHDRSLFIHTLPRHFTDIEFSSLVDKIVSSHTNDGIDYGRQVEKLDLIINKNFSLRKSLAVISQYRRVKKIIIHVRNDGDLVKDPDLSIYLILEEQLPVVCLPKLSQLIQVNFYGPMPSDLNHFSFILNAAPNLFRLDLSLSHLLRLIEDQQICHLLGQRITSLSIFQSIFNPSLVKLNEEHIPIIASVFPQIRDMYLDWTHLPCSRTIVSNEDILEDSFLQNSSIQSCQQKDNVILPSSSESMLLCLLTKFKEHKLIGLCIDGQFLEEIKADPEQWLRANTILCEKQFKAVFNIELNQLIIWM